MPGNWEQVKELFASALERSCEERNRFLKQACAGDDALRSEVESLLANYQKEQSFLEKSPASDLWSARNQSMVGLRLGAYRIVGPCGRGGMAEVYLAERADEEFRQRVAIKMVGQGANSEQILSRFRNERQALAGLVHPNIVRLLDGGSTDDGMPYIVMEYVDGLQIEEYCDGRKLTVSERLRLFRTVCEAVQYAHDHRVIHRDLKPSNILITADGIPRLLDFGIAKVLDPALLSNPALTRTDWRPMTPRYASPEQVRGGPITNATDIYSLGVLLYELLTGHCPYAPEHVSSAGLERSVCEDDPEKPSTVISRTDQPPSDGTRADETTAETVASYRATNPDDLRRLLRGDLDTIVLKAIHKDSAQRYTSVNQFSEDIQHFLDRRPIKARRPTLTYRSGKFLGRHKESLATAVTVLAVAVALGTWQALRLAKNFDMERRQGAASQVRVRPSLAILGFKNISDDAKSSWVAIALSEMLASEMSAGEQLRTVPGEIVARTKIDLGLQDDESLSPEILAKIRKNLGSDYLILGSYSSTAGTVRLDLRMVDAVRGETIVTASDTAAEESLKDLVFRMGARLRQQFGIGQLSQVESAAVFSESPTNPVAAQLYYQGLVRLRTFDSLGAKDLLTRAVAADAYCALAESALAKAWSSLGYDPQARETAKEALRKAGSLSREKHLVVEGQYYEANKQWDKAITTYRTLTAFFPDNVEYGLQLARAQILGQKGQDALATVDRLKQFPGLSKDDPRIDGVEQEAASLLADNKRSLAAGERAISKATAAGANLVLARASVFQCRILADVGRATDSKASCDQARQLYEQAGDLLGESRTLHAMAEVPLDQGLFDVAKPLYERSLAICRKIGNKMCMEHEIGNIGIIYRHQGAFGTAERMYREAIVMAREVDDKQASAVIVGNLADLLYAEGRWNEALAEIQVSLKLARDTGHKLEESIQLQNMGDVRGEQGDLAGAMDNLNEARDIQQSIGSRSYYAATMNSIGQVLRQKGDAAGAQKALDEALALRQQLGEKTSVAETQRVFSDVACDSHQAAEAEEYARAALEAFRSEKETDRVISAEATLVRALLEANKLYEARKMMAEASIEVSKSRDTTTELTLKLQEAYVRAASQEFARAAILAEEVEARAKKIGFLRMQLEAQLALGRISLSRNRASGRSRLAAVEQAAHQHGFDLIAHEAAAVNPSPVLAQK